MSRAYDLLALIVQRVSAIEYHLFVQRNILDPLGMESTTFELDKAGGNVATGHWRHGETANGAGKNFELANGLNMGMGLRGAGGMMSNAKDMVSGQKV
jgi:CubicO group peptidase (beta-lactamase class C family)